MEILSTRLFAASRDRLYTAFSDAAQLAKWWGPTGFTNTIHEFELRPEGRWRMTMHGPDGANYENDKIFVTVEPAERVVFNHLGPMHAFEMTLTFAEESGGTRLTWRMCFADAAANEKLRDFIVAANEQNFDRLEAFLAEA